MTAAAFILSFAANGEAARAESWGAIAYAFDTGADGYSYGYESLDEAKQRALDECLLHGSNCRVLVWFRDECGALAVGFSTAGGITDGPPEGAGFGLDIDQETAEVEAVEMCQEKTESCTVVRSACAVQ